MIDQIQELKKKLYPIHRSLTGEGVRETLKILSNLIKLNVREVKSGTNAYDWKIPKEWNVKEAYAIDPNGKKIFDFEDNNLHLLAYSIPFKGKVNLSTLKKHLYTLPDQPDLIPFVQSYYNKRWGFATSHDNLKQLMDGEYLINVDTELKDGLMSYGEYYLPGQIKDEVLFSTYTCHPSMGNDNLSGIIVTAMLAKIISQIPNRKYSYRFLFIPETIGSIYYISKNLKNMKKYIKAGFVITCVGDNGDFSFLESKDGDTLSDRVALHTLDKMKITHKKYSFLARGSDERQYNSPGVDLPISSITRSKYHEYQEYHTSADNYDFITSKCMKESIDVYKKCVDVLEFNEVYRTKILCEPQLGKRGLYPTLSKKGVKDLTSNMMNVIAYSDGKTDLLTIAEKCNIGVWDLSDICNALVEKEVLERL